MLLTNLAIPKIIISSYYTNHNPFYSFLISKQIHIDKSASIPYYYGEYPGTIFNHLYFWNQDFMSHINDYQFQIENAQHTSEDTIYKISFEPVDTTRKFSYRGNFYINKKHFAFMELDYHLLPHPKNRAISFYLFDKKIDGTKYISRFYNTMYKLSFKKMDSLYILNYIHYASDVAITNESRVNDTFRVNSTFLAIDHDIVTQTAIVSDSTFSLYSLKTKK